jgi:hypothetical protein
MTVTATGPLTSDSSGASPIDATAATYNWDASRAEVFSHSFHGSLTATLVSAEAGAPVSVELDF